MRGFFVGVILYTRFVRVFCISVATDILEKSEGMKMLFAIRDPICFCIGLCFCFSMSLFGAVVSYLLNHYHRKRVEVLFFYILPGDVLTRQTRFPGAGLVPSWSFSGTQTMLLH